MDGLITVQSPFSVKDTIDRLVESVQAKGLTVFARIDHAANAKQAGLQLRPTELVLFGNPEAGSALLQDRQTAGLDLPMRAVAWEDEHGTVWLTYNDAQWLAARYGLTEKSRAVVQAIEEGMKLVCGEATATT